MTTTDFDAIDLFRAPELYQDPYEYYEWVRSHGPVWREPHHGVVIVTGFEEAMAVCNDPATFSSCNAVAGPWTKFPVPLVGDDIGPIIEEYRDTLPFSDQLPTFDPPKHTAQRGLLMRLITPKRLKENEEFMWRLADRQIAEFAARRVRLHPRVRESVHVDRDRRPPWCPRGAPLVVPAGAPGRQARADPDAGSHQGEVAHKPLEFLYERFTAYIEECRRAPRSDVMTGLATATFPDGTVPEVHEVALIAANLFSAGGETTARLLGSMMQRIGEEPEWQVLLRREPDRIPGFVEESLRLESPIQGDFRLSRVADADRRRRHPAGHHGDGAQRRRQPRPAPVRGPERVPPRSGRRPPAPRVRVRDPHLRRRAARARRSAREPRPPVRPHGRHHDLRA